MAIITIGTGGDFPTLTDAWSAGANNLTDDTLLLLEDIVDPATAVMNNYSWTRLTIDLGGHTLSFPSLPANVYIFKFNTEATWTVKNGRIVSSGAGFTAPGAFALVLENLTIRLTTATGGLWAVILSHNGASLTATNCHFEYASEAIVGINHGLISRSTGTAAVSLTRCRLATCYNGLYGDGLADNVQVLDTSFINCAGNGIQLKGGGEPTIQGGVIRCRKGFAGQPDSSRIGISFSTPFGVSADALIEGVGFATNGGSQIYFGRSGDFDQGTGGTIRGCSFGSDECTYGVVIQANGVVVEDNVWHGSLSLIHHALMLGNDSGTDLGEANRARGIVVRRNLFRNDDLPEVDGTYNHHDIVVKADAALIHDNTFQWAKALDFVTIPNFTFVYVKGGADCAVYNNDFHSTWNGLRLFRLGATNGVNTTNLTIANNKATGTYELHFFLNDANQATGLAVHQNLVGLSAYEYGVGNFDITQAAWFAGNFTDPNGWQMSWGGDPSLAGIALSTQGLAPVGRHDTALPDPVIGSATAGWETPAAALANLTALSRTGVTLVMARQTAADEAALDDWMLAAIAAGQTWAAGAGAILQIDVVAA
ncbi:MAG: hypothetical protein WC326_08050 [Candidatus Delongbacteria bacterium]